MRSTITVAEFCTKHKIERHKLNYQFKVKNIKRDEDKKFDEQQMLELLKISNMSNVEIQHLKEEIVQLNEKLEKQARLIKTQEKRERIKNFSCLAVINFGLFLHPKTRILATDLLPYTATLLPLYKNERD